MRIEGREKVSHPVVDVNLRNMNQNAKVKIVSVLLMLLPLILIGVRLNRNQSAEGISPKHKFLVSYQFEIKGDADYNVRTFLPTSSQRQRVDLGAVERGADISLSGSNKVIRWKGKSDSLKSIKYDFEYMGEKVSYLIDEKLPYTPSFEGFQEYLEPTPYIQSNSPKITGLAEELVRDKKSMIEVVGSFYDFVFSMPSAATSELTDAVMALDKFEASCNGKSRLFVALCRSMKIPARVTGGLILEETKKKTSHLWAEVQIGGQWVPFDALNGHFAQLPAHYLELYKGDEFLITRNKGIAFDYIYDIRKERVNDYPLLSALNLWEIAEEANIPTDMFRMLLLLPLGAFLVAIFKNVIGLKTYGVFLPVLISLALIETGLGSGLVLFTSIVLVVALVNFPLEKWGIQYTSKIAMMLIAVVVSALLAVKVLHETNWLSASAPLFFPIIILTIISERFAKKIEEEGLKSAIGLYASTLVVTLMIYFILSATTIQNFVMTFPEIIISIAGLNLMLGKWIGLRVMEYYRFHKVIKA